MANCRSVVDLSHGFGNRMVAQGRGGIVLFSSLVGFNGAPQSATYAATKGFVQSFAEGIAAEMRPHGVSVLSVAPGPVGTGFAERAGMQMGQVARPEAVARSALAALGRRDNDTAGVSGQVPRVVIGAAASLGPCACDGHHHEGHDPQRERAAMKVVGNDRFADRTLRVAMPGIDQPGLLPGGSFLLPFRPKAATSSSMFRCFIVGSRPASPSRMSVRHRPCCGA